MNEFYGSQKTVSNDWLMDVVRGEASEEFFAIEFFAEDVQNGVEEILAEGSPQPFQTAPFTVQVVSNNAADDIAGAGARRVRVQGLIEDGTGKRSLDFEDFDLVGNGTSVVGTKNFVRVFRTGVLESGTYGTGPTNLGNNVADVVVETSGGVELLTMRAGQGTGRTAVFQTPDGVQTVLRTIDTDVPGARAVTLKVWRRDNADDTTAPVRPWRLVRENLEQTGQIVSNIPIPISPSRVDLMITAEGTGGAASAARATLEFLFYPRE